MTDITKCANKNCLVKHQCYRFTAPSDSHWQSFADFNNSDVVTDTRRCEYFIKSPNYLKVSKPKSSSGDK